MDQPDYQVYTNLICLFTVLEIPQITRDKYLHKSKTISTIAMLPALE
jgi:hypothetical protein